MCGNSARRETGARKGAGALRGVSGESGSAVQGRELRACSACDGEYEDPDRTAWPADEENRDAEESESDGEFLKRLPERIFRRELGGREGGDDAEDEENAEGKRETNGVADAARGAPRRDALGEGVRRVAHAS